jgi:2-iminobutanoate/2-iminopropanoate deaminase
VVTHIVLNPPSAGLKAGLLAEPRVCSSRFPSGPEDTLVLETTHHVFKGVAMTREIVSTDRAPAAIGPYSQAVKTRDLIFVSGQIPIDPDTGGLITGDIRDQTRQAMQNLTAILAAAGSSLERVVKTTLYIADMDHFGVINDVYADFFASRPPARACVQVARLPRDVDIEIEAVALHGD